MKKFYNSGKPAQRDYYHHIRDVRHKNNIRQKDAIKLFIETASPESYGSIRHILSKQANAECIKFTTPPEYSNYNRCGKGKIITLKPTLKLMLTSAKRKIAKGP